ncbi:hypothetical protein DCO56_12000 [Sphingobacterium athyrii]|uniref:Uncharacterized protein n=1 Tax=Sphingobacterium athyrii TaxID=2152717 RepID=A0A363NTK3_9SPHI|nr:hypothetical protein DCO56_12000 [Sphingobacterium athyrii]
MFPIDHEFKIVYALYILLFCYIIYRILVGGKGETVRLIFIVFISVVINVFLYIDPVNFQGGASLGVLFYSLIIWLFTALVTAVNCIFSSWKKKT